MFRQNGNGGTPLIVYLIVSRKADICLMRMPRRRWQGFYLHQNLLVKAVLNARYGR
jgi:hypothetical protein